MSEPVDLDGIEARANAATDRPYSHLSGGSAEQRSRDAEFIVGARDDVLALVAEVRALRAKVEATEAVIEEAVTDAVNETEEYVHRKVVEPLRARLARMTVVARERGERTLRLGHE